MSQLAIAEAGPIPSPERSQWFTDPKLARDLVGLAWDLFLDANKRSIPIRVLEPSAGRGNLVRAVVERCPIARVDAIDVDARWVPDLEATGANVEIVDYLERPAPARRYDLTISNPPYTGGEEVGHLAKILDESERALLLLPGRSLHGRERYDRIWSRIGVDWWLRQQTHLITRPRFGRRAADTVLDRQQSSGGIDEIVLLDLRRAPGDCVTRWL